MRSKQGYGAVERGNRMNGRGMGDQWPQDEEYEDALPAEASDLLRPRRPIVPIIVLVVVFGIAASLFAAGLLREDHQVETTPSETAPPPQPVEPSKPPAAPVEQPNVSDSLVVDSTKSYLATGANTQPATEAERL